MREKLLTVGNIRKGLKTVYSGCEPGVGPACGGAEKEASPPSQAIHKMRNIADSHHRNVIAVIVIAAGCTMLGCSSEPQAPELTAAAASAMISEKWAQDLQNHFAVSLHSDTLIECGVGNDLWKLVESTDRGYTRTAYELTPKGNKVLFAIDLKGPGRLHEVTLRGPYHLEVTNITPGPDPDSRRVEFHWEIDWDKAPPDLKLCLPKFELAGSLVGLFKLEGLEWKFMSYSKPEDSPAPQGSSQPLDKVP